MIISDVFTCPDCGGHRIEEIEDAVVLSTDIIAIYEGGDCDFGDQTADGGVTERFQCVNCGHILRSRGRTIDDFEDLYLALRDNKLEEERQNAPVRAEHTNQV